MSRNFVNGGRYVSRVHEASVTVVVGGAPAKRSTLAGMVAITLVEKA